MKKLMILGGGYNQVPLIKAAQANGYKAVLCDFSEKAEGVALADEFYLVSIIDKEGVLEAAKQAKVDGIISNSEPAMAVVAWVGNQLGLPSNDYNMICRITDKLQFRSMLKEKGFSTPAFGEAMTYEQAEAMFDKLNPPIMVKPAISSGSRGVVMMNEKTGLMAAYNAAAGYSRNDCVVIEEYVENHCAHVIAVDFFVSGGEVVFCGMMSSIRNKELRPLVPRGAIYPPVLTAEEDKIMRTAISDLTHALGLKLGTFNADIVLDKDNRACFIEVNPRNGGTCSPDALKAATGFDIFDATVRAAMGESIPVHQNANEKAASTYMVHSEVSGVLKKLNFSDLLKPYIVDYRPDVQLGSRVEEFYNAEMRIGLLVLSFNDAAERDRIISNIDKYIEIVVE